MLDSMKQGDGEPHDDTREIREAIAWQDGYFAALSDAQAKVKELVVEE